MNYKVFYYTLKIEVAKEDPTKAFEVPTIGCIVINGINFTVRYTKSSSKSSDRNNYC